MCREILVKIPNTKFQEEELAVFCTIRGRKTGSRSSQVFFSDAANESYVTCVCVCVCVRVSGVCVGGGVEVGVHDGRIWLRDKRLVLAKKSTS
jgi:hypothetical protein